MLIPALHPTLRRAPVAVLLTLAIALLIPAVATAAPSGQPQGGVATVPSTAVLNAALTAGDGAPAKPAPALRQLAARDGEIVTNLVYNADQDQQQAQSDRQPYELSLLDAVEMALRNNFNVQIARYGPENSYEGVVSSRANFDPRLTFTAPTFSRGSQPTTNQTQGGDIITSTGLSGSGFTWVENLEWGTNYSIRWNASRNSNNNAFNNFNPTISSSLSASVTQPLLNGFGDVNRTNIRLSMIGYESSLEGFRSQVQSVLLNTINAYWQLRSATSGLEVAQESLTLAEEQYNRNTIQVQIGTLAPIEQVQAETQRASSRLGLINAQLQLENAQETLKQVLNFDAIVDDGQAYDLVLTDDPETTVPDIDAEQAIQTALANDPSIRQQRLSVQSAQLGLDAARNGLLPNLSVSAGFNLQGRAGDRFLRAIDDFGAPVNEIQSTSFWAAQAQILSGDFNTWNIGASISFPLHNYSAKAAHARASISERQQVTALSQAEQQITYTVRNNVRSVQNLVRQVETAHLRSELAQRQYQAEQRKFDVGTSTNFNVLNLQNQLSNAKQSELNTILQLQRALAQLEQSKGTLLEAYGVSIDQAGVGGTGR